MAATEPVREDSHPRYSPGWGLWVAGQVRAYEGLDGAASALGVGAGYSWDLVGLQLQYVQSLASVAGHHPGELKLATDFAFITHGSFSAIGRAALAMLLDPPNCQLSPLTRSGSDCRVANGGPMVGPELGLGARYRWSPSFDVYGHASAELLKPLSGPREFFLNPGVELGVVFHPFAPQP